MQARGRGRARGRSRGQQGQAQQVRPGEAPVTTGPPSQTPGPQGVWGKPRSGGPPPQQQQLPQQQSQSSSGGPWATPQTQASGTQLGRGTRPRQPEEAASAAASTSAGAYGGGGDAENLLRQPKGGAAGPTSQDRGRGNGGVRGKSDRRNEIIKTKPETMESKKGTQGRIVNLTANYFPLIDSEKFTLYQYRVDFSPDIDNTAQQKKLLSNGLKSNKTISGYLFDGTVMYTAQRINPDPLEVFVQHDSGENVRISIRLVGDVANGDHHYIQLYNIIVRKCLWFMRLQLVGRDYFDPKAKIQLSEHKLQLWPGYHTSMRQQESCIMLNCEVKFKVMRTDTVYDMLLECRSANMRREFQSKVVGTVVLTAYNNKTYRIDDVDFSLSPNSLFTMKDGSQISFVEYYKVKYGIQIKVLNQPLLVSRSKPREIRAGMPETVLLIPELCQMTGLTDRQRENFHLMKALAEHTRMGPPGRIKKLMEFSRRLTDSKECIEELRRWDLNIANSLVKFQGRVLPPEDILTGDKNKKFSAGPQADWTKDLRCCPMFVAGQMSKFAIICPSRFSKPCEDFVKMLERAAHGMNWPMKRPRIFDINDDRSQSYLDEMENIIQAHSPHMIMCVVPNNSQDRYSAIKKKGCVDRGVPTQVILGKNLSSKGAMSIATKVVIQLNCKVGGAPWSVIIPLSSVMVVGYDVCRDTAKKGRSFGAMVASIDKQLTRYFSFTQEHELEEELSNNFASFLLVACERYKQVNSQYPQRIIIYRDGVGEGQLPYVYEHEVANIKAKLKEKIYTKDNLMMAFVVVSKRINTRIFCNDDNAPPGTVVDDVITLPERYDFFIVSQCVRQGTVSPTNYNVIADTSGLPPNHMQIFTYKMCHMYYNWSGTVRVPAPCQYAHKLAFLVAQSLHRPAHRALEDVLYYL